MKIIVRSCNDIDGIIIDSVMSDVADLLNSGWLEPLLDRIADDWSNVVTPVIDVIEDGTFKYLYGSAKSTSVGGFDWNLQFNWHGIPEAERLRRKTPVSPIRYSQTRRVHNFILYSLFGLKSIFLHICINLYIYFFWLIGLLHTDSERMLPSVRLRNILTNKIHDCNSSMKSILNMGNPYKKTCQPREPVSHNISQSLVMPTELNIPCLCIKSYSSVLRHNSHHTP